MNDYQTMVDPSKIGDVPFLHPAAWKYIEYLVKPEWTALEHGCGASTIWLAHRLSSVISYDYSEEWMTAVRKKADSYQHLNIELRKGGIARVMDEYSPVDFLLIDGTPLPERGEWMKRARWLVKPGGVVCVDNVDKVMHAQARKELWDYGVMGITVIANPKHKRNFVTDFVRMPGGEEWI